MLREQAAHRGERRGVAQAQGRQALAQRGDLDQARRGGWQLIGGDADGSLRRQALDVAGAQVRRDS